MATIVKLKRKTGYAFKAIIKDRKGRLLKTKTMRRKPVVHDRNNPIPVMS